MASPRVWQVMVVAMVLLRYQIEAKFTVLPANISAIAGETVVLRCSTLNTIDIFLYWSKGHVHLSLGNKLLHSLDNDIRSRYTLRGNHTIGEYDLTIENVTKSDAGDYQCSYIGSQGGRSSPPATMTVYVPPPAQYPLCSVQAQKVAPDAAATLWPGAGAEFTCQSSGGDPPAMLQWMRANHSIVELEPQPSNIVYTRVLVPEDNGVRFTCVATSPALREPRTCSVMPMRILPVVQVRPLTRMIIPGDNATYHCEGSAIPHVATYSWRVAGQHISEKHAGYSFANQRQLLTIHDVKQSQDELEITCEASTPTGIAESASVKMVVTPIYVPPAIVTNETPIDFTPKITGGEVVEVSPEEDTIINGDLFLVILIVFGSLVILLLVVAVVMGCWALNAKGKRPQTQKRPRVEFHESTANAIDMDPLPLPTPLVYEPPTTISSDPIAIEPMPTAADQENAPGYISQLYSTLDPSRLPSRMAFPDRPIAQITPTQGVASTLPRTGRIDKPFGTGKPIIKECPASFTVPEEKTESQRDRSGDETDKNGKDKI